MMKTIKTAKKQTADRYKTACSHRSSGIVPVILKKALFFLLSILLLSAAVFFLSRLAPGDPLVSYYGSQAERMSPQQRELAEERLGLDDPVSVQYIRWLDGALHGDFGISYKYKTDVLEVIAGRLGNTALLAGTGFVLIFALALLLGTFCARCEDSWPDRFLCRIGTAVSCIPEFWLALLLILIFSVQLRLLPGSGAFTAGGSGSAADRLAHLILPLTVVVSGHLWYYAFMIRNRLLEEVKADYVLLARAKGLTTRGILFRHCLRCAFPSCLSIMALSVPHIIGGTYITEAVFSYPGIGTLAYESARYQDYNLLMVICLLSAAVVIFCNALSRMIIRKIDPRIDFPSQLRKISDGDAMKAVMR